MSKRSRRRNKRKGPVQQQQSVVPVPSAPPEQMRFVATAASYSGPIPPPEMLERFNEIIPKGAHRILRMAEKQQAHRLKLEARVINSDIHKSWGGLIAGFIITLVAVGVGAWLIWDGHDWAGTTVATGPVISLVATFITGTVKRQRERAAKAQAVSQR